MTLNLGVSTSEGSANFVLFLGMCLLGENYPPQYKYVQWTKDHDKDSAFNSVQMSK